MFSQMGPLLRQYGVVIIVNLNVLSFGMSAVWPSPVLVKLRNATAPVLSRPITEEEGSWIVSIINVTGIVFIFVAAYMVDLIGRKYSVLLICIPKILTCLIFTFATEVWMVILARAFDGVAEVFTLIVIPIYASEIASKEIRGALGTIFQICSTIGILIMLCMGPYTSYFVLNLVFMCITIATAVPSFFLPDSPYYLFSSGREKESIKVLTFLRGSETIAKEEIKEYRLADNAKKHDKKKLFKNKIFLKCLAIAVILGSLIEVTGYNAIAYYLQTILESSQTNITPEIGSVIIGLISLAASVCTSFITDRFGRKPILIVTLIGMSLGMIGLGTFFKLIENSNSVTGILNLLPMISLILFAFSYSAGFGSIYCMLITELFEGPARAIGVSASMCATTVTMFLTTKYYVYFTTSLGAALTYWIFSCNCILLGLFIILFVPETKQKTFAEIQVALGAIREPTWEDSKPVSKIKETARTNKRKILDT